MAPLLTDPHLSLPTPPYPVALPASAVALTAAERRRAAGRQALVEAGTLLRRRGRSRTPSASAVEYDRRWAAQARTRRWDGATSLAEAVRLSSYGQRRLRALMDFQAVSVAAPDYFGWRADKLATVLAAHCEPDERVVELGCGLGKNLLALAHGGFSRLAGLDVSGAAVAAAGEQLAAFGVDADLARADLLDLDGRQHGVAGATVLTNYVLEQFPDHLEPVLRRLAAAGPRQAVHLEPCPDRLPGRQAWELLPSRWHATARHYQRDLLATLHRLERRGVLTVLEVTPLGFSPYLFHSPVLVRWAPVGR